MSAVDDKYIQRGVLLALPNAFQSWEGELGLMNADKRGGQFEYPDSFIDFVSRIKDYTGKFAGSKYRDGENPWGVVCHCAFPSATQNEISGDDAKTLVRNGCMLVAEGANMPTSPEGIRVFQNSNILYGPGKAANAGGVACSGLEMAQDSQFMQWPREEVDGRLHQIMVSIHQTCFQTAEEYGQKGNYVMGANIAGFCKVADAMIDQGVV